MNLFNEYENKNIIFLLSYINQVISGNMDALSIEELDKELSGGKDKWTSLELIDLILNKNNDCSENLNLLYEDEDKLMQPVSIEDELILLPSLLTKSNLEWLKYILDDPKADLFLNPEVKRFLRSELSEINSPIKRANLDVYRECSAPIEYSQKYINNFKDICFYLKKQTFVEIKCDNSVIQFLGYKIVYHVLSDSFSVIGFDNDAQDITTINLDRIDSVEKSSLGKYKSNNFSNQSFDDFFSSLLNKHKASPIVLEIIASRNTIVDNKSLAKRSMADDRFNHLFSNYDTITYTNSESNYVSEIHYYDFQRDDVIRRILSLGKYARVISPNDIRKSIIDILKNKTNK